MKAVPACATKPALFHDRNAWEVALASGAGEWRWRRRQGAAAPQLLSAPNQGLAARSVSSDWLDCAAAWSERSQASAARTLTATTASTQTARRRAKRMVFSRSGGWAGRDCAESAPLSPALNISPTFFCTPGANDATAFGRMSHQAQRRESGDGKRHAPRHPQKNGKHAFGRAFIGADIRAQVRPPEGDGKARPAARHRPGAAPAAAL